MNTLKISLLVFGIIFFMGCKNQTNDAQAYKDASLSDEVRTESLLAQLTLSEKIKQMRVFHANIGIELNDKGVLLLSDDSKNYIQDGIAGIKNPGTEMEPDKAAELCNQLQKYIIENNRFGIPAYFITECYNGVDAEGNTYFSRPITMASSWNTDLVEKLWDVLGQEARARGFHMCHSPEGDLARDPRFGRMSETFGEDPFLTSRMLVSAIKGVQGNDVGLKSTHIAAVTKHFAGYSLVEGGRNFASMQISPRSFIDEILPPFEAAVKEGHTLGIMASHADVNGIASHGNPELHNGILRNQWGYKGFVVSDSHDIERLHHFMKVAESYEDAAVLALSAGVDVDLYGNKGFALLEKIVAEKPELQKMIDDAARRVLLTKFKLGLFDNPYIDVDNANKVVHNQYAKDLALQVDLESIILLKNNENLLPLPTDKYKRIAVIGPRAGHKDVTFIKSFLPDNSSVTYAKGCGITTEDAKPTLYTLESDLPLIKEAVDLAKKSDLILFYAGGDEQTAKEAFFSNALGDRDNLDPVGQQNMLIKALKETGKKVVLVLEHRRTLSIVEFDKYADAILDCWDLSERSEEAISRVLFGEVNPSGKLVVSVPRNVGQLPVYYYQKQINYLKGYLFSNSQPLYPFGHGLSYTNFSYDNFQIADSVVKVGQAIQVSVDIRNCGEREGKEVCQLYLQDVIASVERPIKELKGFSKINLKPGETATVNFTITPEMMSFTGVDMKKRIEAGKFHVYVGNSSATDRMLSYRLEK